MNNTLKTEIRNLDQDLRKWNEKYYDHLPSDVLKIWRNYYRICQKIIPMIDQEEEQESLLHVCFYTLLKEKEAVHIMGTLLEISSDEVMERCAKQSFTKEEIKMFLEAWRN